MKLKSLKLAGDESDFAEYYEWGNWHISQESLQQYVSCKLCRSSH